MAVRGSRFHENRHYGPATTPFTQEDPIGLAGGLNLYGFANGDPVNFSDPFGLDPCVAIIDRSCVESMATAAMDAVGQVFGMIDAFIRGAASEVSGWGDLMRGADALRDGDYAAAGGSLLMVGVGAVPGGKVAANLRRTVKSARGADVAVEGVGSFYKATWTALGGDDGQARAVWTKVINGEGNTILIYHDNFNSQGVFTGRKSKFPNERVVR